MLPRRLINGGNGGSDAEFDTHIRDSGRVSRLESETEELKSKHADENAKPSYVAPIGASEGQAL